MIGTTTVSDKLWPLISKESFTRIIGIESDIDSSARIINPLVSCDYIDAEVYCEDCFRMTLYSGVNERMIIHKYKGLTEVPGIIGCKKDIILLFFAVIFKIFYGSQQKLRIVQYVYGLEPDKQEIGWHFKKRQAEVNYKTKLIPSAWKDVKDSSQKGDLLSLQTLS